MDLKTYDNIAGQLIRLASLIESQKRPAYTIGSADVHANFRRSGDRWDIAPGASLGQHMDKHYDAICSALREGTIPQAEPLETRFADLLNYAKLGFTLLVADGFQPTSDLWQQAADFDPERDELKRENVDLRMRVAMLQRQIDELTDVTTQNAVS